MFTLRNFICLILGTISKDGIHPLMKGDALVLTLLHEVLVTDQSTLLVVNQIVPETGRQPLLDGCYLFAQTGVDPKDIVSWIKAKVDVSEIQKEKL